MLGVGALDALSWLFGGDAELFCVITRFAGAAGFLCVVCCVLGVCDRSSVDKLHNSKTMMTHAIRIVLKALWAALLAQLEPMVLRAQPGLRAMAATLLLRG
jgi:hypothetical protein